MGAEGAAGSKIVRKGRAGALARSFSLALKSSVPIEQALHRHRRPPSTTPSSPARSSHARAGGRGETILRSAAAAGVFTPVVLQMIAVGETGSIDELMDEVAELYTNDVQYELKTLSSQIEPILVVILGCWC